MADMVVSQVSSMNDPISLVEGEAIVIRVMNADGSLKGEFANVTVPAGKTAVGNVSYYVTLV